MVEERTNWALGKQCEIILRHQFQNFTFYILLRENATICKTAVGLIHEIKNDKKYCDAVPLNDYTLYKLTPLQRPVYTEL